MKKIGLFVVCLMMVGMVAFAQESPVQTSKAEIAKALVQKTVAFYKANGLEATIKAVNDTKGPFVNGEYYVFIHRFDGINLARGDGNVKRLGTNVLDSKDPDGKLFVVDMIKQAQTKGVGVTDYKFKNPKTGLVEQKYSYYEKVEDMLFGCGYYGAK